MTRPGVEFRGVRRFFCIMALAVGPALHGITAIADWRDRDYSNVEKLVRENVTSNDWLYGDFSTYYAAKKTAARVFMPLYLAAFLPSEKGRLTVLVIAPENFNAATNIIGGTWGSTGKKFTPASNGFWATRRNMGFLSTQNYELEIYRRERKNGQ
jgi:hypothetical protein